MADWKQNKIPTQENQDDSGRRVSTTPELAAQNQFFTVVNVFLRNKKVARSSVNVGKKKQTYVKLC